MKSDENNAKEKVQEEIIYLSKDHNKTLIEAIDRWGGYLKSIEDKGTYWECVVNKYEWFDGPITIIKTLDQEEKEQLIHSIKKTKFLFSVNIIDKKEINQ